MRRVLCILLAAGLVLALASVAQGAELGSRLLRSGARGDDVVQLQRALHAIGFGLHADGVYGPKTVRTVRRFERRHHLKVDGIVGKRQARQILRLAAASGNDSGGVSPTPPEDPPPVTNPPPTDPPPTPGSFVFPVAGAFGFGGAASRFGAPRAGHVHEGQDVSAAEGTPLLAVTSATVSRRAYQDGGAGNYIVLRAGDGHDYVYMHLRYAALVHEGDHVSAGERVGYVGQTGAASGPHLHFEVWTAHWRDGGHPIDPLPYLQSWLGR
jgi:murein DD-endopeptidase MepM/ murein hydrolase activator NlpD